MTAPGGGNVIGTAFVEVVPLVRDFASQLRQQLQGLRQLQAQQLQGLRQQQLQQLQGLRQQQAAQLQLLRQQQLQQRQLVAQQQQQVLAQLRRLGQVSQQQLQQVRNQQLAQLQQLRREQQAELQRLQATQLRAVSELRGAQLRAVQELQRQQLRVLQETQRRGQQQLDVLRAQQRENERSVRELGTAEVNRLTSFRKALRGTLRDLKSINRDVKIVSRAFTTLGFVLAGISVTLPIALQSLRALALVSIAGNVLALAGAFTDLSGAVALLPAGITFAGAVLGTLAVGLFGVDKAFKDFLADKPDKFAEDLAKLSKNARETLKVLTEFKPQLQAFKNAVQDALFVGLADVARQLGRQLLPRVELAFIGIARSINEAARAVARFALTKDSLRDVDVVTQNVVKSLDNLAPAAVNVAAAFRDVTVVGSRFLPGLAAELAVVTALVRDLVADARASGALEEFILRGIDAARSLIKTLVNVAQVFAAITRAAREAGVGFLDTLERATRRLADFARSEEGQNALTTFFVEARVATVALAPVLNELVGLVVQDLLPVLIDFGKTVAPAAVIVVHALRQALDVAAPGIHALADGFASFLVALTPALPAIGALVGALATLLGTVLEELGPAFAEVVRGLAEGFLPVVQALTDLIKGLSEEQLKWIIVIGLILAVIGPLITALRGVLAVVELLTGAFAFFITPVGLVVAGLLALIAILVFAWKNSATFRDVIRTAAKALGVMFDVIRDVWQEIKGPLSVAFEALKPLLKAIAIGVGFVLIGLIVLFTGLGVIVFGIIKLVEGFIGIIVTVAEVIEKVFGRLNNGVSDLTEFVKNGGKDSEVVVSDLTRELAKLGDTAGEVGGKISIFGVTLRDSFEQTSDVVNDALDVTTLGLFGIGEQFKETTKKISLFGVSLPGFVEIFGTAVEETSGIVGVGLFGIGNAFNVAATRITLFGVTITSTFDQVTVDTLEITSVLQLGLFGIDEAFAAAGDASEDFASRTTGAVGDAVGGVATGLGKIKELLFGVKDPAGQAGSAIGESFSQGLGKSLIPAKDAAFGAVNAVNQEFSKKLAAFGAGAAFGDDFVAGLLSRIAEMRRAALLAMRVVSEVFPHSPAEVGPFSGRGWSGFRGRALVDDFARGMQSAVGGVRSASLDVASVAADGFDADAALASLTRTAPVPPFASSTAEVAPTVNLDVRVLVDGRELRGVVVDVVDERGRALRRNVQAGVGGAR